MTVLYCKTCKVILNMDIEPRLNRSVNCDCHNELQKLAVRMPDDATNWHLSTRARLLTIDDSFFNDSQLSFLQKKQTAHDHRTPAAECGVRWS